MNTNDCRNIQKALARVLYNRRAYGKVDFWLNKSGTTAENLNHVGEALQQFWLAADRVDSEIDALLETQPWEAESDDFSESEAAQLRKLNRLLTDISDFLRATEEKLAPKLKAKAADTNDPMVDFEIEAHIAYVLREDDPEFDDDKDNYLSSRIEYQPMCQNWHRDWREGVLTPEPLRHEPLCFLLYSLTSFYSLGYEAPQLSLRDCLRIGSIFIDIRVTPQFHLNVERGEWFSRRWDYSSFCPITATKRFNIT